MSDKIIIVISNETDPKLRQAIQDALDTVAETPQELHTRARISGHFIMAATALALSMPSTLGDPFGIGKRDHHNGYGYMAYFGRKCLERSAKDKKLHKAPRARKDFNQIAKLENSDFKLNYSKTRKIPALKKVGNKFKN